MNARLALPLLLFAAGCGEKPDSYASACHAPPPLLAPKPGDIASERARLDVFGKLHWNGKRVSDALFASDLAAAGQRSPAPRLFVHIHEGAHCSRVEAVRRLLLAAPLCRDRHLCSESPA